MRGPPNHSGSERQDWPDRWDFVAVGPILRSLFNATSDLARRVLEHGDSVLDEPQIKTFLPQVEDALRQRVPVSALIVLSERLRQRAADL